VVNKLLNHVRRNTVGYVALFVALSGTAAAATAVLPINSVGTAQLKNGAVTGQKVAHATLTGANIKASTLGTVPNSAKLGGAPAAAFQQRISAACSSGQAIQSVSSAGTPTCQATASAIYGGSGGSTISSIDYLAPEGISSPTGNSSLVQLVSPTVPTTAGNLTISVGTPPGAGNSWVGALFVNGSVVGAPSCEISDTSTSCTDTGHLKTIPAGATVVFGFTQNAGTPPPTTVSFAWTAGT
jgi:hypothetical protein